MVIFLGGAGLTKNSVTPKAAATRSSGGPTAIQKSLRTMRRALGGSHSPAMEPGVYARARTGWRPSIAVLRIRNQRNDSNRHGALTTAATAVRHAIDRGRRGIDRRWRRGRGLEGAAGRSRVPARRAQVRGAGTGFGARQ